MSVEMKRACDTCGARDVPLEILDGVSECARCKVRGQSYDRGAYDNGARASLRKSAEAMFRAMNDRGLRAIEIREAARAVGEGPVADFIALLEQGDAGGEPASAENELQDAPRPSEGASQRSGKVAEGFASMHNYTSPHTA